MYILHEKLTDKLEKNKSEGSVSLSILQKVKMVICAAREASRVHKPSSTLNSTGIKGRGALGESTAAILTAALSLTEVPEVVTGRQRNYLYSLHTSPSHFILL